MNRIRNLWLLTLVGLPLVFANCDRPDQNGRSEQQPSSARTVAVLQLGTHEVIDAVVAGLSQRLAELHPAGAVQVRLYNPNFDSQVLATQARQIGLSDAAVVVTVTTPATISYLGAGNLDKPLVFTFVTDTSALSSGSASRHRFTGLSDQVSPDSMLDLIRGLMPNVRSIGYLITQSETNATFIYNQFEKSASSRGVQLRSAVVANPNDIRTAAEALAPNVDCFLFGGDNMIASNIEVLIDVGNRRGRPVFANDEMSVQRGAVAAITVDYERMGHRTADVVSQVLAGANPSTIPVAFFQANKLVLNTSSASRARIVFPESLLQRADRVIP